MAVGVAQTGHRFVKRVPRHPQPIQVEATGLDITLANFLKALATAFEGAEIAVPVFVLHFFQFADHVIGPLLESLVSRCGPHQTDGRQVMPTNMPGQVLARAIPTAVWFRLGFQPRSLAIVRQHAIRFELKQVLGIEVLRVFQRTTG